MAPPRTAVPVTLLWMLLLWASTACSADASQPQRRPPKPPAAEAYVEARRHMVQTQIAHPVDGRRRVRDKRVLEAMRATPRHIFVPEESRRHAHRDTALPIGEGQTISQPYIVAIMTELLQITEDSKILEIGTGSGYQAAVLAQLTDHVHTVEVIRPLARRADEILRAQGYEHVRRHTADGYFGLEKEGPFDGIIVTCAAGHLPPPLWEQLKPGGRIVIPLGSPFGTQRLLVISKDHKGKRTSRSIMAVRFVPMTGRAQKKP